MANGSETRERVAGLLAPVLADVGLDLDEVELTPAGRRTVLRVVVDADGGVTLDRLADTSNSLAKLLDSSDVMGSASYTLEVTSRGVDRPLTQPRHWRRNVGRLVKVVHPDGRQLVGRVADADDDGAELETNGSRKRVEYASVAKARVQVEFAKRAADEENGEG